MVVGDGTWDEDNQDLHSVLVASPLAKECARFIRTRKVLVFAASVLYQVGIDFFSPLAHKTLVNYESFRDDDFKWHPVQHLSIDHSLNLEELEAALLSIEDSSRTPALRTVFLSRHFKHPHQEEERAAAVLSRLLATSKTRGITTTWTGTVEGDASDTDARAIFVKRMLETGDA